MKKIIKFYLLLWTVVTLTACSGMTDTIDEHFKKGEIIYIAKSDSAFTYAGDKRFLLEFWISDPRASAMYVYWNMKQDSVIISIPEGYDTSVPFRSYIGRNEKTLEEGAYVLNLVTHDQFGNLSVTDEYTANVYGDAFANSLLSKIIVSSLYETDGSIMRINWGGAYSAAEYGIKLTYKTLDGEEVALFYTTEELKEETVLENVDIQTPVMYTTLFLPEPTAIDTFYTAPKKIDIISRVNVVLNKPATWSDENAANQGGNMAIDGDQTTASRWVSNDSHNEHWLEVDLLDFYAINGFGMWRDQSNATQKMKQFRLQAWIDDQWVDVVSEDDNIITPYTMEFESVTTNKVRLYIPPYTDNRTRLCEIEVYSTITY